MIGGPLGVGVAVTRYPVVNMRPVVPGAVHETNKPSECGITLAPVGSAGPWMSGDLPGLPNRTRFEATTDDAGLSPMALLAVTVICGSVLFESPKIVQLGRTLFAGAIGAPGEQELPLAESVAT